MSVRFTAREDEHLIELVQGHPIIWNQTEKEYKNVAKKEVIWNEIGKMLKRSGVECKTRWKNVKDYYKKQRKEERNQTTGSAATKRKAGYWDRLSFLDVVDERIMVTNIDPSLWEEEDDPLDVNEQINDVISESEAVVQVRDRGDKREAEKSTESRFNKQVRKEVTVEDLIEREINSREEDREKIAFLLDKKEDDEMDLFFRTMAATTKKFSPQLKRQAKIQVFNIITELEGQNQDGMTTITCDCSGRSSSIARNSKHRNRH